MTVQYDHRPSTLPHPDSITRSRRARRWVVPAGLATVAVVAVLGATQFGDDTSNDATSVTKAQTLIQQSIDDALAANHTTDHTRAQTLIQQSIDDALAANHTTDHTRAQTLVQQSIDDALAGRG